MSNIFFKQINKKVTEEDIRFLYHLLESRKFSISHECMPTYEDHRYFVLNNPYFKWYIVSLNKISIGSIYINSDNSVSINILDRFIKYTEEVLSEFHNKFKPQDPIKSFRYKSFFFNLNPNDKFMINILEKNGYTLSQLTFRKN